MSEVTKKKILEIDTGKSQQNVKSLRAQIKDLKDQMAQLEVGSEEYNRVAKQLADTNQKQIEINEAMKYSNKDLGATLSNLAAVSAGVIGAINGVNAVMQMMGADSEQAEEAMRNIQLTMALVQGMGAMDTAVKALQGLKNAFTSIAAPANVAATEAMAQAEKDLAAAQARTTGTSTAETAALNENTAAKVANAAAGKTVGNSGTASTGRLLGSFKKIGGVLKGIVNLVKSVAGGIVGWVAVAGVALAAIAHFYAKAHEEERKRLEEANKLNYEYQKQYIQMGALVEAFKDENTTAEQRKALAEEINNLAKDELVTLNKQTGELELHNDRLADYQESLKTTIELEFRRQQIMDLMAQAEEAHKNAIHERTHLLGSWFRTEAGYLEDEQEARKEIDRLLRESVKLTAQKAENDKKSADYTNSTTKSSGGIVKTFKQMVKEIKDLYGNLVNTIYDERAFTKVYNGIYRETEALFDNIERIIKSRGLEDMLTESFRNAVNSVSEPLIRNFDVTVDNIFGKGTIKEFEEKLMEKEGELTKLIRERKTLRDPEVQKMKEEVDILDKQLESMKALAEAAQKYADHIDEVDRGLIEMDRQARLNSEANERELQYRRMERSYDPMGNAESFRNITQAAAAYNEISESLKEARDEYEKLVAQMNDPNNPLQNKAIVDRVDELFNYIQEAEQEEFDAMLALEDANYQARVRYLEKYKELKEATTKEQQDGLELDRFIKGFGVPDFNTDLDKLKMEMNDLVAEHNKITAFYDETLEHYVDNAEMYELITIEKQKAITEIENAETEKRAQIAEEEAKRKITATKAYFNAYQTLSNQTIGIMNAVMDGMDENSKTYKNMKYAQGVIDTISGTLAGYMSGVESGLPAPANVILGAAIAASVLATGIIQLNNLRNERLSGSAPSASVNTGSFSTYDTLAYQTNADILETVGDSRVYVVESDIRDTQRRVQVVESNSTF